MNGWRPLLEQPHRPSPPTFEHGRAFAIVAVPAFLIAWPIARSLLDWLVNGSGLLPSDIEPITTSPLDVVLIQLRTAVALVSIVLGGLVLARSHEVRRSVRCGAYPHG